MKDFVACQYAAFACACVNALLLFLGLILLYFGQEGAVAVFVFAFIVAVITGMLVNHAFTLYSRYPDAKVAES